MNIKSMLERIDGYKKIIESNRPLDEREVLELKSYYKIGLTYSSNALEGNSLTLTETKVLLEDGLTVGGKPFKDSLEAVGHAHAYDFMYAAAREKNLEITEKIIQKLHYLFYTGIDSENAGEYRKKQVYISGVQYIPPAPDEIPKLMKLLIPELKNKSNTLHPVLFSAYAHRRLVDIHPFEDGNGRTARLLMNLILINKGYYVVSIPPILCHDYIEALILSQKTTNPDDTKFNELILTCEIETQKEIIRLLHIELPKR